MCVFKLVSEGGNLFSLLIHQSRKFDYFGRLITRAESFPPLQVSGGGTEIGSQAVVSEIKLRSEKHKNHSSIAL